MSGKLPHCKGRGRKLWELFQVSPRDGGETPNALLCRSHTEEIMGAVVRAMWNNRLPYIRRLKEKEWVQATPKHNSFSHKNTSCESIEG